MEEINKVIEEIWKPIINYEGFYEVSSWGRIKSLQYHGKIREKILKPCKNQNWKSIRFFIDLKKNGIKDRRYIHQLVAETFIGPYPPGMEICHNDGDATNNHVENLRYGTHKENMVDMSLHGRSNKGIKNPNAKLEDKDILSIIKLINENVPLQEIANKYGVSVSIINNIKNKKYWSHLTYNIPITRKKIVHKWNKGTTKFNADQLKDIRKLIDDKVPSKDIAKKYSVSFNTINRIKQGITFKGITNI